MVILMAATPTAIPTMDPVESEDVLFEKISGRDVIDILEDVDDVVFAIARVGVGLESGIKDVAFVVGKAEAEKLADGRVEDESDEPDEVVT